MHDRATYLSALSLVALLAACSAPLNDTSAPGASESATDCGDNCGSGEQAASTAPSAAAAAASSKWVSGYYVGYQQNIYPPEAIDFTGLTHLVAGRIVPYADGSLNTSFDTGNGPELARRLSQLTRAAGKKAILMVGGAGAYDGFVAASASGTRARFVANLVRTMRDLGYDGLDIDWEPIQTKDFASVRALASDLRAASPGILLTIPVTWGASADPFYGQVAPLFDQINIMSYGMADNWPGWQSWHSSAIFGETATMPSSIDSSVKAYLRAGVPAAKIGLGIGAYGSCWSQGVTGPRQNLNGSRVIANDNVMSYTNIMAQYYSSANRQWDNTAKVPFLSFAQPRGPQGCTFVSYDDAQAILEKGKYAHQNGLGGAIIWTINQGYIAGAAAGQRNPLLQAAKEGFLTATTTPPPPPPPPPTTPVPADASRYNFEAGVQGWTASGNLTASVASSTARAFAGTRSLAVTVDGAAAGHVNAAVSTPAAPAGATVTFRVWIPAGATAISGIQPYALQGAAGGWGWTSRWYAASTLQAGAWNTVTLAIPANAVTPLAQLGLEVQTTGAFRGTLFVDAVTW